MEFFGDFLAQLYREWSPLLNWSVNNWATTLVILLLLLFYRTGHSRRRPD